MEHSQLPRLVFQSGESRYRRVAPSGCSTIDSCDHGDLVTLLGAKIPAGWLMADAKMEAQWLSSLSKEEILRFYLHEARLYHPDRNPGKAISAERFAWMAQAKDLATETVEWMGQSVLAIWAHHVAHRCQLKYLRKCELQDIIPRRRTPGGVRRMQHVPKASWARQTAEPAMPVSKSKPAAAKPPPSVPKSSTTDPVDAQTGKSSSAQMDGEERVAKRRKRFREQRLPENRPKHGVDNSKRRKRVIANAWYRCYGCEPCGARTLRMWSSCYYCDTLLPRAQRDRVLCHRCDADVPDHEIYSEDRYRGYNVDRDPVPNDPSTPLWRKRREEKSQSATFPDQPTPAESVGSGVPLVLKPNVRAMPRSVRQQRPITPPWEAKARKVTEEAANVAASSKETEPAGPAEPPQMPADAADKTTLTGAAVDTSETGDQTETVVVPTALADRDERAGDGDERAGDGDERARDEGKFAGDDDEAMPESSGDHQKIAQDWLQNQIYSSSHVADDTSKSAGTDLEPNRSDCEDDWDLSLYPTHRGFEEDCSVDYSPMELSVESPGDHVAESATGSDRISQIDALFVPLGFRMPRPEELLGKPKHWFNLVSLEPDDPEAFGSEASPGIQTTVEPAVGSLNPHGVNKIPRDRSQVPAEDPTGDEIRAHSGDHVLRPVDTAGTLSLASFSSGYAEGSMPANLERKLPPPRDFDESVDRTLALPSTRRHGLLLTTYQGPGGGTRLRGYDQQIEEKDQAIGLIEEIWPGRGFSFYSDIEHGLAWLQPGQVLRVEGEAPILEQIATTRMMDEEIMTLEATKLRHDREQDLR